MEDFRTFTEVEPDDRIQKTQFHVDFVCCKNEDSRLYKDYGANFFGDFEHLIDEKMVSATADDANGWCWVLSNDVSDNLKALHDANATFIAVLPYFTTPADVYTIRLWEDFGGVSASDISIPVTGNTTYYLKITKTGANLSCFIYSNPARTVLVDTLTLVLGADHQFRYLSVCQTWNEALAVCSTMDIDNLEIGIWRGTISGVLDPAKVGGVAVTDIASVKSVE